MTKEQIESMAAELGKKNADQVKGLFEAARVEDQEAATKLEAKLMTELGPDSEHMKAIQGQLDQIATDIKKASQKEETLKTLKEQISIAAKTDAFQKLRETKGAVTVNIPIDFNMETKVGTMLNSGQSGAIPKPTWIPGVFRAPDQLPFVAEICPIVPTTSGTVYYVDRTARTAAAAAITEGSALSQNDMTYTQQSQAVADYGAYLKISDNMLGDNDFVAGQINAELPWDVMDTLDGAIITSALAGATAFSSTGKAYDAAVINANYFDVLRAAVNQARASHFQPDTILVHYDDYAFMEMSKNANGSYTIPQWAASNGLTVSGVRIIPSSSITTGTYLVASFKRTPLALRQNLTLEFGYDADDFTKRLITARAYVRAAYIFSSQMGGGFITSTFATAQAALLKA